MPTLLYVRLIGFTAGTLLMLFWMVVILGYRRQRNFERVFFFLCLALFLFYGGSLLDLNAQVYYAQPPPLLTAFAWTTLSAGLCFAPALLLHLHLEYASTRKPAMVSAGDSDRAKRLILTFAYAFVILFSVKAYRGLTFAGGFDFLLPANSFGKPFGIFLASALGASAGWQFKFAASAADTNEKLFHRFAAYGLSVSALLVALLHIVHLPLDPRTTVVATTSLALLPIPLFAVLIYAVQKHNFLQIGRQTNLMYAVSVTFLALLYLALVRRASGLLEPILPPEATASVLLFILVVFVEPMQRLLARRLHETVRREMDRVQLLMAEVQNQARQGNLEALTRFFEHRARETFELYDVRASFHALGEVTPSVPESAKGVGSHKAPRRNATVALSEGRISQSFLHSGTVGFVRAEPHGSSFSGETRAALEAVCEQLPAAIELCCAVQEKVQLERELAERERLAALGQMAASISHNLKNPLGSIKTILQVQLESPEMPDSLKSETQMVLSEISRLSGKLSQLLQFSRPAVLGDTNAACDAAEIVREVTEVLCREADRNGIVLQVSCNGNLPVVAPKEAVNDILSNLVVNALEAASTKGRVMVTAAREKQKALIQVEDDGGGIPADLREKVLQPFFTTKTQGTGLGLAIVVKRVSEANGTLELESPVANGRGTRFSVWLPLLGA
jgi:signal transduction histidine kinase